MDVIQEIAEILARAILRESSKKGLDFGSKESDNCKHREQNEY